MPDENPIEIAKGAMNVLSEMLKAAGDDPNVKKAAANLGKTAVTVTSTVNTLLLPFAAINFGVEKARAYFTSKFEGDLAQKTKDIPAEKLVEPKASIAGPAVQGLAYSHEEDTLKDMYLNLLATAMDGRVPDQAHPAFVEVIKQLSGEEARLLGVMPRGVFTQGNNLPIANVLLKAKDAVGIQHAYRHLQPLTLLGTTIPTEHVDGTAIAENWLRLGLVEIRYDLQILVGGAYAWVEQRPEVVRLRQQNPDPESHISFEHGILRATAFGARFARAVGIAQ